MRIKAENIFKKFICAVLVIVMLGSPIATSGFSKPLDSVITASAASAVKLSACSVTVASSVAYTGSAVKPAVTVKNGKTTLKKDKHYTVKYSANKEFGTASVTVTAVKDSGYTGSKTVKFKIVPGKATIKATNTTTSVNLTWSAVKGATKYDVYSYDTSAKKYTKLKTVTSPKYTVSKLTAGKTYSYAVKAYAVKNKTTYTGSMSAVKAVATKPSKVSAPTASAKSTTEVSLSWKKVSGASGYKVYSYNSSKDEYKLLLTTTALSATVKELKAGTAYKLCVSAYRTADGTKYEGAKSSQVSVTTKPAKVGTVKATPSQTSVALSWGKVTGATGYYVYSYDSASNKYTKIATVKTTTATVSSLKSGAKYSYAVCAYITANGVTVTGSKSAVVTTTTSKNLSAKENLDKVQKIIRSGTFNIKFTLKMKDYVGSESIDLGIPGVSLDNMDMTLDTYVKNGNMRVDTNMIFDFTFLYLKDKKIGYMLTDGMPPLMPKSYQEMKGKDATMDGFLDSKELVKMLAPNMAKGESVKESTKKVGTKTYKTATFKAEDGSTMTYFFYNNEFKILEIKEKNSSTSTIEISKLSSSVSDSKLSLPKDFPKGYEKF